MSGRAMLLAAALILIPLAARAEADRTITVNRIAPGFAVLSGYGGVVTMAYGPDGVVLVDDEFVQAGDRLTAAIRSVDGGRVRLVINTHCHADHTGGNAMLRGQGALVAAHPKLRARLAAGCYGKPPAEAAALPDMTLENGGVLHLNGDEIRLIHAPAAHTDGDTMVHWRRGNVLAMGDVFFNGMLPVLDVGSGGSIDGLIAAVETAIALCDDRTVVVAGHGPVGGRTELAAYRDMLKDLRDRVSAGIARGESLEQIKALRPADRYVTGKGWVKPDELVQRIHASLIR